MRQAFFPRGFFLWLPVFTHISLSFKKGGEWHRPCISAYIVHIPNMSYDTYNTVQCVRYLYTPIHADHMSVNRHMMSSYTTCYGTTTIPTSWLYTRWIHLPSQYMPCMLSYHPNILECSPKRIHSWVQMLVYQYTRSYVHWLVFTRQLSGNTDTSVCIFELKVSFRYALAYSADGHSDYNSNLYHNYFTS